MVWFLGGNPNGYPETLSIEAELYALMYEGGKNAYYEKMSRPENRGQDPARGTRAVPSVAEGRGRSMPGRRTGRS